MKRLLSVLLLLLPAAPVLAQGMYGVEAGLGKATSYSAHFTPTIKGYLMGQVGYRVFIGGQVSMERYSFVWSSGAVAADATAGDIIRIRQKSTYTYFAPKLDYAIGYRKYIHFNATAGAGIFTDGSQQSTIVHSFLKPSAAVNYTEDVNTSANMPTVMWRYGLGISERIPTLGFWNIMLSQEFGYLAKSFHKDALPDLRTNYFSFTVGIMHNYNQVLVEY